MFEIIIKDIDLNIGDKYMKKLIVLLTSVMMYVAIRNGKTDTADYTPELEKISNCLNEMVSLAPYASGINNPAFQQMQLLQAKCDARRHEFTKKYGKQLSCHRADNGTFYGTFQCKVK